MDPSAYYLRPGANLLEGPRHEPLFGVPHYMSPHRETMSTKVETGPLLKPAFVDEQLYGQLVNEREEVEPPSLPVSIFHYPEALVLANIDAVFNLTGHSLGIKQYRIPEEGTSLFNYLLLGGAPGGFVEYLQFRRPHTRGYGAATQLGAAWDQSAIQSNIFKRLVIKATLVTYWESLIKYLRRQEVRFDLALCVEPIESIAHYVSEGKLTSTLHQAPGNITGLNLEQIYQPLLIRQLYVALRFLAKRGNLVVRLYDVVSAASAQIIYLVAQVFGEITLFQPVSSTGKYLIALNYKPRSAVAKVFKELVELPFPSIVTNIIEQPLPSSFTKWLTDRNNEFVTHELDRRPSTYHWWRALTIWNLPSTPIY